MNRASTTTFVVLKADAGQGIVTRPHSPEEPVIYRVTARLKADTAAELRDRLGDGSIAAQRPDGQEIVDSLHRAVVTTSGEVQWSEQCFCDPPLAHERATILDRYFDAVTAEPIAEYEHYDGLTFTEYLQTLDSPDSGRQSHC